MQHIFNGQQGDRTAVDDSPTISYTDAQTYRKIPGAGDYDFGGTEQFARSPLSLQDGARLREAN